ncbi:MAG: arylsulfatase [Lentisphaerales bacterium]|nr:arylsulfatase [Lentisphaerales bacterium]
MKLIIATLLMALGLTAQEKPNIILMMADDMGYSDIGCYGGEIKTPNLDRMAREGIRFRQFYNNAKCTTTRASITTGLYPQRDNGGIEMLDNSMFTIADAMNKAGYFTFMSGKWHLGSKSGHRPIDRGFQEYYGLMDGCANFFNPVQRDPKFKGGKVRVFGHNDKLINEFPDDFYQTDAFTDHAVEQIKKAVAAQKPFFGKIMYTAPHYPLHAKPEDIAKYKGRYKDGWHVLRNERYQRQLEMGVIDKSTKLHPEDPRMKDWDSRKNKDWDQALMEVYAAMVDSMDQNIGKILKVLDETGTADNTLILFISDNGGCAETPGGDNNISHSPGPKEFYTACGPSWATAQNTPFKRHKVNMHEGGINTPCVVRWPAKIKPNTWTDSVAHIIDLQPTCMAMAGLDPVKDIPADKRQLDGENILPIFEGQPFKRQKPLFFEFASTRAVRDGDWKAVYEKEWLLYNIAEDRTEMNNVAVQYPERLASMSNSWDEWAKKTGAPTDAKKSKKKNRKKKK